MGSAYCELLFVCFDLFTVLLLCFVSPVWHCNDLAVEKRAGFFVFLRIYGIRCGLFTLILVPLVHYRIYP